MNKPKTNNELFIKKYNELDNLIDNIYHLDDNDSAIIFLINKFKKSNNELEITYSNKLNTLRKVRNLFIHESGIINDLFDISNEIINLLDEIIEYLKNPVKSKDIMIKTKDLTYAKLDSCMDYLISNIVNNGYSNIPILDDEFKVIGVFNSDVLLNLYINNIEINKNTKVADILKFLDLKNQLSLRYIFVSLDDDIDELNDYFKFSKQKYKKRLPIIFVTKDGDKNNKLEGIITPIDLINTKK